MLDKGYNRFKLYFCPTIDSHASLNFQDSLRDAGCLLRLQHLIVHSDRSVRLAAIAAVGNLALNTANQRVMQVNIEAIE